MKNVTRLSDGSLVRRVGVFTTVRENYCVHRHFIRTTLDMRATLRAGPFTDPGGYPLYFLTSDGGTLCFKCARAEYRNVSSAIKDGVDDGWRVEFCEANYEDSELYCSHCNERIESAYAEEDSEEEQS